MSTSWVLVLLAAVVLGSQRCLGASVDCSNVAGFETPEAGTSSFLGYKYEVDGVTGECSSVNLLCNASVPVPNLSQRSWFIEDVKNFHGLAYKDRWLQVANVQCPPNHVLHLFPQDLRLFNPTALCPADDFVAVNTGSEVFNLCGGEIRNNELFNSRLGVLVDSGNATIVFCSDDQGVPPNTMPFFIPGLGFSVRATCINLEHSLLPGCIDFQTAKSWDGEFVNKINDPFMPPTVLFTPHKRSAEMKDSSPARRMNIRKPTKMDLKRFGLLRKKRFVNGEAIFMLIMNQSAVYDMNVLTIDFNNGSFVSITTPEVAAFNELIGTRIFVEDSPIVFHGPAEIRHTPGAVTIFNYAIPDISALVVPGFEVSEIINRLSNYLYNFYIKPYPIIEDTVDLPTVEPFPLDPSTGLAGIDYITEPSVPFVKAAINGGTCRRVIIRTAVPQRRSFPEANVLNWCSYFQQSCNAYLRAICDQVAALGLITS